MTDDTTHFLDRQINYSYDEVARIHETGLDVRSNHIYLFGHPQAYSEEGLEPGVEYLMASRFITNLNILMRKSSSPILIHMNTCGGDETHGYAMYNSIRSCPNHVTILNYTSARSMSSLIFLAADKRVMFPNSTYMFHGGTTGFDGTTKQFLTEAEEAQKSLDQMIEIYTDAMKEQGKMKRSSRSKIREWLEDRMDKKEEVYLDAKEAVQYGFAHEIFGEGTYDWEKLYKSV